MQVSAERMGNVKAVLMGAVLGAAVLAFVGFKWGGWVTGGTAEKDAAARADSAVATALAPICVQTFKSAPDAASQLISLQKLSSYQQGDFVEKGGWATPIGSKAPNRSVARACAETLAKLSVADLS
ncbi:MAG: hypothetical protein JNM20_18460 [Rhizobiales bacterium]|nr:hypothetical protein [Hyphomicrobiales bacterium]